VSGTVTSHANGLPFAQGSSVTPSGRLPSSRLRPAGSFAAGIAALLNARHRMSLSWLWRWCLGPLLRHARPWRPRALTALPHSVWFAGLASQSMCHSYSHCFVRQSQTNWCYWRCNIIIIIIIIINHKKKNICNEPNCSISTTASIMANSAE